MKIRTFWRTFFQSLTSPQYYLDVLNARFSFSVKFFFVGYLCLALLATGLFATLQAPIYQRIFSQNATLLQQNYPQDLVVKWDGQKLTTSNNQPIELPYPTDLPHDQLPTTFAKIVPSASSLDQATTQLNQPAFILITQDHLYLNNSQGGWSPLLLSEVPGFETAFTMTAKNLPDYVATWKTLFDSSLSLFTIAFPMLYFLGIGLIRILSMAINCVFIFYLLKLTGRKLPYLKIFQLGLHISVIAGLVDILTTFVIHGAGMNLFGLAFWLYFTVILLALGNVSSTRKWIKRE